MEQKYKEDYEEVQCIGRGNFGKFSPRLHFFALTPESTLQVLPTSSGTGKKTSST